MSFSMDQVEAASASGGDVYASESEKVGGIGQFYLDNATGEPKWVTAKTGLFGTKESFVPLDRARLEGNDVYVDYAEALIKDAPQVEQDGQLSPDEEQSLYTHYGISGGQTMAQQVSADDTVGHDTVGHDTVGHDTVGHDTSGPTTDDAMTRSEEQLRVGTATEETGRARLRKYVVTENVTTTVPVSHEEVRVEREPITDANRGAAESGPAISEEEHEVVLHAERPVVEKEAVPVERVKMTTDTVTEQETVTDEVRKEQIDVDDTNDATDATRRR